MMQERARRRVDIDLVGGAADRELVERLDRRFRLALGGAEGGEIVLADQRLRGAACIASASSSCTTCQTRPLSSAGGRGGRGCGRDNGARWPKSGHGNRARRARLPAPQSAAGRRNGSARRGLCRLRNSFSRSKCATCPSACTPASVRPAPVTVTGSPESLTDRLFQRALHRRAIVLALPADKRARRHIPGSGDSAASGKACACAAAENLSAIRSPPSRPRRRAGP